MNKHLLRNSLLLTLVIGTGGWLASCASTGVVSASGTPVESKTLTDAELRVNSENIRPELRPYFIKLYSEGRQNSVLHEMEGGLEAMHLGEYAIATRLFDQAIQEIEAMQEGEKQAERAKSKFVGEQEKWFKGEPYERSALYFYRGMLYLNAGDFDNASACFKRSQIEDITAEDKKGFAGDWQSDELALAMASYWANRPEDAEAAFQRIQGFASRKAGIVHPVPAHNLLVLVEVGDAVMKVREGKEGERLTFREHPTKVCFVQAEVNGARIETPVAEDFFFQATTRGGRQIDSILKGKAQFKEGTGMAAVGLGAGAIAASQLDKSGYSSLGLAVAAIGAEALSLSTDAKADVRTWSNLPHSTFLLPLNVEPGSNIKITALGASHEELRSVILETPVRVGETKRVAFINWNL